MFLMVYTFLNIFVFLNTHTGTHTHTHTKATSEGLLLISDVLGSALNVGDIAASADKRHMVLLRVSFCLSMRGTVLGFKCMRWEKTSSPSWADKMYTQELASVQGGESQTQLRKFCVEEMLRREKILSSFQIIFLFNPYKEGFHGVALFFLDTRKLQLREINLPKQIKECLCRPPLLHCGKSSCSH